MAAEVIRTVPNPQLLAEGAEDFWSSLGGVPELKVIDVAKDSVISDKDFKPLAESVDERIEELITEGEAEVPNLRELLTFDDFNPLEDWVQSE